jgi:hypothetical protein
MSGRRGVQRKRLRIVPTKSEIIHMIQNTDDSLLRDDDGRLYGLLQDADTIGGLKETGEIDGEKRFAMWVFLPTGARGPYATQNKRSGLPHYILTGEDLVMPEDGSQLELYNYRKEEERVGTFISRGYIERIPRNSRVASIILELAE